MRKPESVAVGAESEGWHAASINFPKNECPYHMGTPEYRWWMIGYECYENEFNDWLDYVAEKHFGEVA